MVEKILNNTTPYGKIRASHEGSLHSSTLRLAIYSSLICDATFKIGFIDVLNMRFKPNIRPFSNSAPV